jgi:hypothetical protein
MVAATHKTVLFGRAVEDKKTRQWPIAVFNHHPMASAFARDLKALVAAGDFEAVKLMDPHHPIPEEGKPAPVVTYSVARVPYNPSSAVAEDGFALEEYPSS